MKFAGLLMVILFLCPFSFAQEAEKIDEFGGLMCDEYLNRMYFISQDVKEYPTSKVYVLVYEGKDYYFNPRKDKTELVFPNYGLAKAKIRSMKDYLKYYQRSLADQFVFVEAGFRENLTVEFWRVPIGATPPKPTPTLTKMKYRKGKAKGFCLVCC